MPLENAEHLRFLIADDSVHIRKIIKAVCFSMGVRNISEAGDGGTALDLIDERRMRDSRKCFDLIICDWMMPEHTGIEILHSVRSDPVTKKTPFLMVTAESDKDKVVAAIKEGVSDYIIKPFTADVIEAKITSVLAKKK